MSRLHCYGINEQAMQAFVPFLHTVPSHYMISLDLVSVSPELWYPYHTTVIQRAAQGTQDLCILFTAKIFKNYLSHFHQDKFFFIPFAGRSATLAIKILYEKIKSGRYSQVPWLTVLSAKLAIMLQSHINLGYGIFTLIIISEQLLHCSNETGSYDLKWKILLNFILIFTCIRWMMKYFKYKNG